MLVELALDASGAKHAGTVDSVSHGVLTPHRHTPPVHILSIGGEKLREAPQAFAEPHLHTPDTQVSEFPLQGALEPHLHTPLIQVPDIPQFTPRQGSEVITTISQRNETFFKLYLKIFQNWN